MKNALHDRNATGRWNIGFCRACGVCPAPRLPAPPQMPRYRFENFTTANGLPNNHVFAVLVGGDRIWAGTEIMDWRSTRTMPGRSTQPPTGWHNAPSFLSLWTSAPAMCGPEQWVG
jgi:hypothetical protein